MTTSDPKDMSNFKSGVNVDSTAAGMKSDMFSEGGDAGTGNTGQASKRTTDKHGMNEQTKSKLVISLCLISFMSNASFS